MKVERFGISFACPIPVGHRVELRHYERNLGVFGEDWKQEESPSVVVDLDTGVHFVRDAVLARVTEYVDVDPTKLSADARFHHATRGRVESTHVVTHASGKYFQIVTVLMIRVEPADGESPAYR